VTDYFEPFAKRGIKAAIEIERNQGINLAKAAAETLTLQHYIWSTLPNIVKISNGKYAVPHFVAKNQIDDFIKSSSIYPKTTFIWNTYYASNLLLPMFKPNYLASAGKYVWLQPTPASTKVVSLGDQASNVGPFTLAILKQPKITQGKTVLATVETVTKGEILEMWSSVTGKPAEYVEISLDDFDRLWPKWGLEMGEMLKFWEDFGDKSWTGEEIVTPEQLGVTKGLIGLKEAIASYDFGL
jgi:hypothetical protein